MCLERQWQFIANAIIAHSRYIDVTQKLT